MHCCSCQMQYCFNKLLIENCTPVLCFCFGGWGGRQFNNGWQSNTIANADWLPSVTVFKVTKHFLLNVLANPQVLPDLVWTVWVRRNYPTGVWMHSVEMLRKNKSPKWRANKSKVCQRIVFISSCPGISVISLLIQLITKPYWQECRFYK